MNIKIVSFVLCMSFLYACSASKNKNHSSTDDIFLLSKSGSKQNEDLKIHYINKKGKDFVYIKGDSAPKDYTLTTGDKNLVMNLRDASVKGSADLSKNSNYLNTISTSKTISGSKLNIGVKEKKGFKVYRRPSGLLLAMGPGYQEVSEDELNTLDKEVSSSASISEDLDALLSSDVPANNKTNTTAVDDELDQLLTPQVSTVQPETSLPKTVLNEQVLVQKDMGKPATIKGIKINNYHDRTEIIVQADRKIRYEKQEAMTGDDQIIVDVPNSTIASSFNRSSLELGSIDGVVASINPYELDGPYSATRIDIQLNESVQPKLVSTGNTLKIIFPFVKALSVAKAPKTELVDDVEAGRQFSRMSFEDYLAKPTSFYGSRMSIEVSNADVLDVLKMIKEVSGINIVVSSNVSGKVNVSLKNVPWDQALSVVLQNAQLGYVRQGSVIRVATLADLRDERKLAAEALDAHQSLEPLRIMVSKLHYINANEAELKVKSLLSSRGRVSVDKEAKTIVIHDIEDVVLKAERMLKAIDTRPIQVAIEANIIEASDAWIRAMGFAWATDAGDISFKNISGFGNISATIGMASVKGDVKIVSAPRIFALDRQTASILQGTQVAYKTSVAGPAGELSDKVEFENIQVVLDVTPRVTANNEIILDVNVKREFPDYTTRTSKNLPPGVGVRKATTQIILKDGDTAVIGGLYSLDTGVSEAGVPLITKVPIIGWFFGKSERREMRSELLIFIRAKIKEETVLASM